MITCIFDKITKKTNSQNGFDFGDTSYRFQNKGYNFPVICFKGVIFGKSAIKICMIYNACIAKYGISEIPVIDFGLSVRVHFKDFGKLDEIEDWKCC